MIFYSVLAEAYDPEAFNSGSELFLIFSLRISLFGCNVLQVVDFPAREASNLVLSIFGHKISVLKSPALFQGKKLQVTRFMRGHVLLVLGFADIS